SVPPRAEGRPGCESAGGVEPPPGDARSSAGFLRRLLVHFLRMGQPAPGALRGCQCFPGRTGPSPEIDGPARPEREFRPVAGWRDGRPGRPRAVSQERCPIVPPSPCASRIGSPAVDTLPAGTIRGHRLADLLVGLSGQAPSSPAGGNPVRSPTWPDRAWP